MKKRVMVDLSATIIHHGHIRLLKKAKKFGDITVALTTDKEIRKYKGYSPELSYKYRKEILSSIKYVSKIIKSNWKITDKYLKKNKIDLIVRGSDYKHEKFNIPVKIYTRTKNISSTQVRKIVKKLRLDMNKKKLKIK